MAIGDKIQLAMKSEVTAVNSSVTTLNTTVNDPTTGLVFRVTNLEAGGGAGMTPQQVADLTACVTDKHTHTNKAVLDLVQEAYTTAEKTKLGNLTDNFKGLFADAAARNAAVTVPLTGNYVLQEDTNTVWYYNGTSWLNTGVTSAGDMLKAVYDPTNKIADAFSMASMVETATKKVMTEVERDKLKFYRGHITDATTMNALADLAEGHYCTRQDTKTVWLYDGTVWANTVAATTSSASIGDTKFSYRTADHDGWYILDGRSVATLSGPAQAAAATLGWNTIIPNTKGMFPLAASPTALSGTIGGSNTIARSALPNFTLTGSTGNESTPHSHVVNAFNATGTTTSVAATNSTETNVIAFSPARTVVSDNGAALGGTTDNSYMALAGADRAIVSSDTSHSHSITLTIPSHSTQNSPPSGHTHSYTTASINGGVTQTQHMPTYSAKTEFVYLGL
jgi:hypothetical protein